MIYKSYELTKVNENYNVIDKSTESGKFFYIDNFYKNPELLSSWVLEHPRVYWKMRGGLETRNGIDYYDCRLSIETPEFFDTDNLNKKVLDIIGNIFDETYETNYHNLAFNLFKNIGKKNTKFQHMPHTDNIVSGQKTALIYLDKVQNGGTMTYRGKQKLELGNEEENLFVDVENNYEFDTLLESKFNRLVIFDSDKLHGAYINDYSKYVNDWRVTQVFFLTPVVKNKVQKTII